MRVKDRRQIHEFDEEMRVSELLRRLNLLPNTVLVVRGEEVLTEDEMLHKDDEIRIVRVISGG